MKHALAVGGLLTLLFGWLYLTPVVHQGYLAESDLYEYFLPVFLSPLTIWSSFEFGGMPAFADPGEPTFYPLHLLFARVIGSWTAFVVSAYVLAAGAAYAYVYSLSRSKTAAALAGLAYGLSEAMMERLAHLATVHTIAWAPLVFLAVDRLRGPHAGRWIAWTALILGNCLLAGNPQTFLYICYAVTAYGITGGLAERAGLRYYAAAAAAVVGGALLSAVKSAPMLEASLYTARQMMRLENFYGFANTPGQMLSIFFPAITHSGREAPTYVGFATLVLALTTVGRIGRDWRITFWWVLAVVTLLIGMGGATPVAELAYQLPFYDKFRVGARHLILASLALCLLAGLGLSRLERRAITRGGVVLASAATALMLLLATFALRIWPEIVEWDDPGGIPLALLFATITIVAVNLAAWRPHRLLTSAVVLLLVVDLVVALPYDITPFGLDSPVLSRENAGPSVHATQLAAGAAAHHQRLLAPEGTHIDDVVPAAFARLWRIPIAGGYGPMLLASYSRMAAMGTNGSVDPLAMAADNAAFDLMAVRYVFVHESAFTAAETIERHGLTWTAADLRLPVGPAECGQMHQRTASYGIPPGRRITALAVAAHLRCAENVEQGAVVATIRVVDVSGEEVAVHPLRAGIDIAEGNLDDERLLRRARHQPARLFDPEASPLSYLSSIALSRPVDGARLVVELTGTSGWLEFERLSTLDDTGRSLPMTASALMLSDSGRWRPHSTFATSRQSDRGTDETTGNEQRVRVFENLRARPRAWLTSEVVALPERAIETAIASSLLPDGRRFDPSVHALVPPGAVPPGTWPQATRGRTEIVELRDGFVRVAVSAPGGGFLVVSETAYPGWRARVDGQPVSIHPAYVALQGVAVPPGDHSVELEFESDTLRLGAIVSATGLLLIAATLFVTRRRNGPPR